MAVESTGVESLREVDRSVTVSIPSPEKFGRAADTRQETSGRARSLAELVARKPSRDARGSDNRPVLRLRGGERVAVAAVGVTNGSVIGTWVEETTRDGAANDARVEIGAVERKRLDDLQRSGSETSTSVSVDVDGCGRSSTPASGERREPVAATREHEQRVAGKEQLVAPAVVELERVEQLRRPPLTSTASSEPFSTANSVVPFVLTRSGSSTSCSCTFVPE